MTKEKINRSNNIVLTIWTITSFLMIFIIPDVFLKKIGLLHTMYIEMVGLFLIFFLFSRYLRNIKLLQQIENGQK